jgi:glutamate-ammonia-ligase adenylyltransferase
MSDYANFSPICQILPGNPERVELGRQHWREKASRITDPEISAFAESALDAPIIGSLLDAVFGHSPFLSNCLVQDLAFVAHLFNAGHDQAFASSIAPIEQLADGNTDIDSLMTALRRARRQVALTVGLADLTGSWDLQQVTGSLSRFADTCLRATTAFLLRDTAEKGALILANSDDPAKNSVFVVLAMGKLGSNELNYSSDIDLILLYDNERVQAPDPNSVQQTFVRLARSFVKILEERTADGYVFRTDLRLRPDPGSTPLVVSVMAAETYYESQGQNWERAAMIKARPAAGDVDAGNEFLDHLRPFIWRKHLDFAALADIQSIKRQIEAQRGGSEIAVEGHNIKLGRGGIREIEFFVQTQQLIWGGRSAGARQSGTFDGLTALTEMGRVEPQTAAEMGEAYRFLRTVEHRLQMINDEQTQILPETADGIELLAAFLGLKESEFRTDLTHHMKTVAAHYAGLFAQSAPLGTSGALSFTGEDHHPDTLQTLRELGYSEAETASTIVRNWHRGRYRAMRSTRARELLTELTPGLLSAIGKGVAPDQALRHFDAFLEGLPAGVQLFSMLHANPGLLDLVTEIMGAAPKLAETLSRNPLLLDGVLSADFFEAPPSPDQMAAELDDRLLQAHDMEDLLTLTRRWANDAKFQIGTQFLRRRIDIDQLGASLSDVADTALKSLTPRILEEFSVAHGLIPESEFAVIALGKLGGREMTESSDLDLVFVYRAPGDAENVSSDGPKPLGPTVYYQRYAQRLVTALTAPLGDGRLYEVDLRLRPSGKAGPIAGSVEGFEKYHRDAAWIWEHMALTRARVVVGAPGVRSKLETTIRVILSSKRAPAEVSDAIVKMRALIDAEHGTDDPWSVKHVRGGLIDCEFLAQFLQLIHAHDHPDILAGSSHEVFTNAAKIGLITESQGAELAAAVRLWRIIQATLRMCLSHDIQPHTDFPAALQKNLIEMAGTEDFPTLETQMADTRAICLAHFESLIG